MQYNRKKFWDEVKSVPERRLGQLLQAAKNRAKTKHLPFDLDLEYLIDIYAEQDGVCSVSLEPFDLSVPADVGIARWNAPSLDRIEPERGYVKGNIRIVTYQVNCGIGAYGLDRFLQLCKKVAEVNGIG